MQPSTISKSRSSEKVPANVNSDNFIQLTEECQNYVFQEEWEDFFFLLPSLAQFYENYSKDLDPNVPIQETDDLSNSWHTLRANSVEAIVKHLDNATSFQEYMDWLQKLSNVINNPQHLWQVLHTEVQSSLKTTMKQSQEIANRFFKPEQLFEFSVESYIMSCLGDISNVKTEEELIDVFYGVAGFIRACNLDSKYEAKSPYYIDFITRILLFFVTIPDFDAYKYVWLVEMVHKYCHISNHELLSICQSVFEDFAANHQETRPTLSSLHKLCIFSTSSFMQQIPYLSELINDSFKSLIEDQHNFTMRYIYGCFVNCIWTTNETTNRLSDPLIEWKLYLDNFTFQIKSQPELPDLLINNFLDESISNFIHYYGGIQPSFERSKDLRLDLFTIVDIISKNYKGKVGDVIKKKIWFLLIVAAVSGASKQQLENFTCADCDEAGELFLGLKHTENEFEDYELALKRLSKKFETEKEKLNSMIEFIRENYEKNA